MNKKAKRHTIKRPKTRSPIPTVRRPRDRLSRSSRDTALSTTASIGSTPRHQKEFLISKRFVS